MSVIAYIGIGSNLARPHHQVASAWAALQALPDTRPLARSPWYRSRAIGPAGQPDYINGVAALDTALSVGALLAALQGIEDAHGRTRDVRWGPRTLDLDILLHGHTMRADVQLTVPHPRLAERPFVVYPLYDIAPDLRLPDGRALYRLRAALSDEGLTRLEDTA